MYHRYYHMCKRYMGRRVAIRCRDGVVHHGRIVRVSPTHVYLTPVGAAISGDAQSEKGKFVLKTAEAGSGQATAEEVLFFSPFAVPLAAIAGITLIGAAAAASPFFWW